MTACACRSVAAIAAIRSPTSTGRRPSASREARSSTTTATSKTTSPGSPSHPRRSTPRNPTPPEVGMELPAPLPRSGASGALPHLRPTGEPDSSAASRGNLLGRLLLSRARRTGPDLAASGYAFPRRRGSCSSRAASSRSPSMHGTSPGVRCAPTKPTAIGRSPTTRSCTSRRCESRGAPRPHGSTASTPPATRPAHESGGGGVPIGWARSTATRSWRTIAPTAGLNIAATENIRKGFVGLALRPNAYDWEFLGMREVLAPLNAEPEGWPNELERNFGPSGSRWAPTAATYATRSCCAASHAPHRRGRRGRPVDRLPDAAAALLHQPPRQRAPARHRLPRPPVLGDLAGYPDYPGGEQAYVFDPVAASFYYVPSGGSGWRRESYDVRSLPLDTKTSEATRRPTR